jgi:hypothetical protein
MSQRPGRILLRPHGRRDHPQVGRATPRNAFTLKGFVFKIFSFLL